ncbi:PP2C family protein-serine/threonine phosphatase [Streptomyces cinereoruber]|nr:PP2C family protein-serine/threonine phosphatase [Streptomyces cinereoruber]MBB4161724.1 serine phosphatase RsbU (regulator of sigma subunit) [Streptomyces cinereoruber]MBY8820041.1 serine/threonine-protein phosphatase [Streptomyces cinereoruber]NIH65409.1 serine phosphatase RsbU (regulator of sigma subunit) [Streptomyces cinereoruber]QEV36548.1 serine/threonine-protein phosphatase [Streptomyces cinereoruber]
MLANLLEASHLTPLEALPQAAAEHAGAAGFTDLRIYVADVRRQHLYLLPGPDDVPPDAERDIRIEGTVAGRAYQYGRITSAAPQETTCPGWWVPLVDGTERLGMLRLRSAHDDARAREDADRLAALLAMLIAGKRTSSDTLARLTRTEPMNIGAEMAWNLMPPRTYADGRVVISASMEMAYRISGDVYEYAIDGPLLHLTIFDAMGHDTAAGLCGALALGACRSARRQGAGLVAKGEAIEKALIEQYRHRRYVTGILATLDTRTGVLSWVNRGHHPPVIIRSNRWSSHLKCPPAHPMGTGLGLPSHVCREQLEPGDRIVLYTDGITEARRPGDEEFGLERFTDFLIRQHADGLPVPETLRRLVKAVLDYHHGELQDDATVMMCEWLGPALENTEPAATLAGLPSSNSPAAQEGDSRP